MNSKLSSSSNRSQAWTIQSRGWHGDAVPWVSEVPTMVFGFGLSRGKCFGSIFNLMYAPLANVCLPCLTVGYGQTCRTTIAGGVWLGNTEMAHAVDVCEDNVNVVEPITMKKISMVRTEISMKSESFRCVMLRLHWRETLRN